MKKIPIILVVVIILALCSSAASTRALHPDTPIFEDTNFSSTILFYVPQNASVIKIDEPETINNVSWQKIQYGSYIGYVESSYLYEAEEEASFTIEHKKATSASMGGQINIYLANSVESEILATVKDGTKLKHIVSDIDYGDFYEISYNNQRAFIQKHNATSSLTYNQKTALIIGSATLLVIAAMLLLISYIKKVRRPKAK